MKDWISVKDRLPNGIGMVYCIIHKMNGVVMEGMFNTRTKKFANRDFHALNHPVLHWMPLPDPPR